MLVIFHLLLQIHSLHFSTPVSAPGGRPVWLPWAPLPSGLANGSPSCRGGNWCGVLALSLQGITLGWLCGHCQVVSPWQWIHGSLLCKTLFNSTGETWLVAVLATMPSSLLLLTLGYCSASSFFYTCANKPGLNWLIWVCHLFSVGTPSDIYLFQKFKI